MVELVSSAAMADVLDQAGKNVAEKAVLGRPVAAAGVSLIPVVSCRFGFGSGSVFGTAWGAAGGFRVVPAALIVIRNETVTVIRLDSHTGRSDGQAVPASEND